MSNSFPAAPRGRSGYDRAEVDRFLAEARAAYEGAPTGETMSVSRIRSQAFRLTRSGYSTAHVDAALERLEDVFSTRERAAKLAEQGEDAVLAEARAVAQAVVNRLARGDGKRFKRVGPFTLGYSMHDVDHFADKLQRYFTENWPITVTDVRTVVFQEQRGGYSEAQVDALLDAVVDVMLAVR